MIGDPAVTPGAFVTAAIGSILLAGSLFSYLLGPRKQWHRILLFGAAMYLIKPGRESDILGSVLLLPVLAVKILVKTKRIHNEPT